LHFLPDLGALYSLRGAAGLYEIHPWSMLLTDFLTHALLHVMITKAKGIKVDNLTIQTNSFHP
jgi:hypothetical protein